MRFKSQEEYADMTMEERKELTEKMKGHWLGQFSMSEKDIKKGGGIVPPKARDV
jgi:hypothetical protein